MRRWIKLGIDFCSFRVSLGVFILGFLEEYDFLCLVLRRLFLDYVVGFFIYKVEFRVVFILKDIVNVFIKGRILFRFK